MDAGPIISATAVFKTYRSRDVVVEALNNVDFEVMPGVLPDAAVVAAIAAARFDPAAPPESPPEPLYLRSSGARAPAGAS